MTKLEYLRALAAKWQPGATTGLTRLQFLQQLATKARGLQADGEVPAADLESFKRLIMDRPDDLRRKLLGANALRRRALTADQRRLLDSLDVDPDLLAPIGELRYEPTHTRLVEYFLTLGRDGLLPSGIVRDFLELAEVAPELVPDDLALLVVRRERVSAEGRVDLFLEMPKVVVLVEMKVDALEGKGQLDGYRKALDDVRGSRVGVLAYLTLPDAPRADTKVPHVHFTLHDLLRVWVFYSDAGIGLPGYLGRYLKSVARLVQCAGVGRFDNWTMREQRAALDLFKATA